MSSQPAPVSRKTRSISLSKLPDDLLRSIIDELKAGGRQADLVSWALCSQRMAGVALPELWKRRRLDTDVCSGENDNETWRILPRPDRLAETFALTTKEGGRRYNYLTYVRELEIVISEHMSSSKAEHEHVRARIQEEITKRMRMLTTIVKAMTHVTKVLFQFEVNMRYKGFHESRFTSLCRALVESFMPTPSIPRNIPSLDIVIVGFSNISSSILLPIVDCMGTSLRSLCMNTLSMNPEDCVMFLDSLPPLKSLHITANYDTPWILDAIEHRHAKTLRTLAIESDRIGPTVAHPSGIWDVVSKCTQLRALHLELSPCDANLCRADVVLPASLVQIEILPWDIDGRLHTIDTDAHLVPVIARCCANLRRLRLGALLSLKDKDIDTLIRACPALEELDLQSKTPISLKGLLHVARDGSLLRRLSIGDAALWLEDASVAGNLTSTFDTILKKCIRLSEIEMRLSFLSSPVFIDRVLLSNVLRTQQSWGDFMQGLIFLDRGLWLF
ncbi:hypothetical protein HK104_010215 [Borealophlyctis nickersoniae]|nr:hypothetical protein HK104_010215 [Borealophlyctis nickersoniae]